MRSAVKKNGLPRAEGSPVTVEVNEPSEQDLPLPQTLSQETKTDGRRKEWPNGSRGKEYKRKYKNQLTEKDTLR